MHFDSKVTLSQKWLSTAQHGPARNLESKNRVEALRRIWSDSAINGGSGVVNGRPPRNGTHTLCLGHHPVPERAEATPPMNPGACLPPSLHEELRFEVAVQRERAHVAAQGAG